MREVDEVFTREVVWDGNESNGVWLDKGVNTFVRPTATAEHTFHTEADLRCPWVALDQFRVCAEPSARHVRRSERARRQDSPIRGRYRSWVCQRLLWEGPRHRGEGLGVTSARRSRRCASCSPFGELELDLRRLRRPQTLTTGSINITDLIFNHHSADYLQDLGPYSFTASSSLFTVAGAIFVSLKLPSPPPSLRIFAVKASFDQTHEITSLRDKAKTMTVRKTIAFFERGWDGPLSQTAFGRLQDSGKEEEAVLFDGSLAGEDGFAVEDVVAIVSPAHSRFPSDEIDSEQSWSSLG